MLGWLRARLMNVGDKKARGLSLIADWLANVLWLIDAKFRDLAQEAYGGNEVVYACLRLLSHAIPEAALKAYDGSNPDEPTPLDRQHPLTLLIKRPNELMTEYEFWELTTLQLAIIGRSTWWKERDNAGNIIALWPLRPDRVGPIYSTSDKPGERLLQGWAYRTPGQATSIALLRRDVLAFNLPDPAGNSGGVVEGLGPTQVLARQISSDNEATKFVGALLANYAAPTIALKMKTAIRDEKQAELIKAKFRYEFGGDRRGTPALLDDDADIQTIGFNLRELEFPELREVSESRIAAAYGVPPILVGLRVGLEHSTYANFKEARRLFAETTLSDYWRRYQEQYTNDLASEFGEHLMVAFDLANVLALAGQRTEALEPIMEAWKSGAATRNEYRVALGLEAVENGNVYQLPGTMIEIEAELSGKAIRALSTIKAVPRDSDERRTKDALVAMFKKTSPDVARRIVRGQIVSDEELAEAFRRAMEPRLMQMATEEGMRLGVGVGVQFDEAVVNRAASEWAKTYGYNLVKDLTDTTQNVIRKVASDYVTTPGMPIGELRNMLEPAFGERRAAMIAVTETGRAYSQAALQYQERLLEQGIEVERVWQTNSDELVCPICGPLHGKSEDKWKSQYPDGPPAHVNCRCSVTLKVK